ncbi:folliculin [Octopus bimaculoides]|uniref:Folliculin n=1 Tax=Octopus bimaculoides TaxID=37653 RepID=A0A0L8I9M4_OCTBM|nr:folliculin [Octopus bimaculoides]|eukprot:XP_014783821.1 PREDICTED: folliculin-like [Octopus bimaculoides]
MNAIIAVCHFCELHGPRIVYCTQSFHPQEHRAVDDEDALSDVSAGHLHNRSKAIRHGSFSSTDSAAVTSMKTDLCEGCYSVKTGFVSHDDEVPISYVSSQHPHHPKVFSMVRQACLRSLSCEVCPGREGPIFFGDKQQGNVLSYTFYIQDNQARGFKRWYSIIIVMMDKLYLLNSWSFLVPNLQLVIKQLQMKAEKVYTEEQTRCPQKGYRDSIYPASFRFQRGGNKPARSLKELTDDKHIFKMLHVSFVWILKACVNRITETSLEAPPTEDAILDTERLEETEEGFIKLYMRKSSPDKENPDIDSMDADPNQPRFYNLQNVMQVLGYLNFHTVAHHIVIGNQLIVKGTEKQLVKSMLEVLKGLLPKGCCKIIPYSEKYEESWRCNFLGVPLGVLLPNHILNSEQFLLIEILSPEEGPQDLNSYEFKISSHVILPDKAPKVLIRMELALRNTNLCYEVIEQCLICLKEEWMNKVKVLFKFTKAGGSRSEDDMKKLLQVVGAKEEDKQLLKFWMTGLSVQYRNHILSTSMNMNMVPP